ncbi:MAG: recombination mediator RecR [Prevotellaceae bacterium]|jgi:recombination protein RecR|nr:recombination mediator RecR [Prevotellaceae bacterium]
MLYLDTPFPSALLQQAVDAFGRLPGVGKRTALRLALWLLKQPNEDVERFGAACIRFRNEVKYCTICSMLSDTDVCPICADTRRDNTTICVVESVRDVMSIEQTGQFRGLYHVLGGIISPIDGIGPKDLSINALIERIQRGGVQEVLFALSTTMEGETTSFYLYKQLSVHSVKISAIARGVGFGEDLESTDELTLGRAIVHRQLFNYQ